MGFISNKFLLALTIGLSPILANATDDDLCRRSYQHLVARGPGSSFWTQESLFLTKLESLGLRLRKADNSDGERVRDFIRRVRSHDNLGPLATEVDFSDIRRFYDGKKGELFMIEDAQGRVVATMGYAEIRPGVMELKRIYLDPALQGQGLGSSSVRFAIREIARQPGVNRIELMTTAEQEKALGVYRLLGFKPFEPSEDDPIEPGRLYFGLDINH